MLLFFLLLTFAANVVQNATVSPGSVLSCPSGFVQCADGQCEPFEALCGEEGVVTVTFPTALTTEKSLFQESASPIVSGTTIDNHMQSTERPVTQGFTETTSTTCATTTPTVMVTDSEVKKKNCISDGKEVCLDGWEQCMDGTCEPFHWLCTEHSGSVNTTTIKPVQTPVTHKVEVTSGFVSESMTEVTTAVMMTNIQTTEPDPVKDTDSSSKTSPLPQTSGSTGTCPNGFVECADGNCEPFEALCGEAGIVTVIFPTDLTTTRTIAPVSESLATAGLTTDILASPTTVVTTTTTRTSVIVTDSSGKEVCLDGWEQCKDGTCEPFHWLCTEHDGTTTLIG